MVSDFPEPKIFTLNCPTQQILDLIADKWSIIVLYCLAYRGKRYNEILKQIEGISAKVLTQSLRKLERCGLIERKVSGKNDSNVRYSLTILGESLMEPLLALSNWSKAHFAQIMRACDHYDQMQFSEET